MLNTRLREGIIGCVQHSTSKFSSKSWLGSAVELAYDKYGGKTSDERAATPLVILHGLFGQKRNWRSLAKQFQRLLNNTVFTLDLRNHGSSPWAPTMSYAEMAEDVKNFLDTSLCAEFEGHQRSVHLLGHSMGGKTAMHLALTPGSSRRITSLIIEDVAPRKYDPRDSHRDFLKIVKVMKQADLSKSRREIDNELRIVLPNDATTREFLLLNLAPANGGRDKWRWKLNLDAIGVQLEEICAVGFEQGIVLPQPCLFVSGGKSMHVTIADRATILRTFPRAVFRVIYDAAHWVHVEKPEEFIGTVVRFIRSLSGEKFA